MPPSRRRNGQAGKAALTRERAFAVAGPTLRSLRVARGWTQQEAAEKTGVSDRLIRKAETGGPLELKSIALLAQLYSKPDARVIPEQLLAAPLDAGLEPPQAARHEALVRRWWEEVWNQGRLDAIARMIAPDCVLHAEGLELYGPGELRQWAEGIRAAFSDIHIDVDQVSVHGDWVISRWRVAMTHSGPWRGTPPTGQRISAHGSTWMRVAGDQLAEGWDYWEQQQATDAVRAAARAKKSRKPKRRAVRKRR